MGRRPVKPRASCMMFGLLFRAFTTFTQLPTFTVPWDRNPLMEPLREAPEPEATRPFPFTFTRPSNHYMLPHPEPDLTNAAIFGAPNYGGHFPHHQKFMPY